MGSSAWKGCGADGDDYDSILRRALDLGITFFDMATGIHRRTRRSVARICSGCAHASGGARDQVYYPMSADPNDRAVAHAHAAAIDRSLARMGYD